MAAARLLLARRAAEPFARARAVRDRLARGPARWRLSRLSAPRRRSARDGAATVRISTHLRTDRQRQIASLVGARGPGRASARSGTHRPPSRLVARRATGRTSTDAEMFRERAVGRAAIVRSEARRLRRIREPQNRRRAVAG